jgi:glycolate oxidase FAD binding subunit
MRLDVRDTDTILGMKPRAAFAPGTVDECAEVLAMAAGEKLRLGFLGGGTALELGAKPTGLDAVVRTERLTKVLEYAPADMVVVVEAGVTLAALQAEARKHGQRLALDAPFPAQATIGGLVATGAFGPLKASYGGVRDLIIGVTLVRADGQVAHGGGKVVKNVAGFDLPKVACGSLGTLGLIAAAAFRLHPLPEMTATVRVSGITADAVVALMAAARQAQLEPAASVALSHGGSGRFDLGVRFEGFERGVKHQVARMVELAGAARTPAEALSETSAAACWRRHDEVRAAAPLRVRVAGLPTRFPAIAALVSGLGDFAWYPTVGTGFAGGAVDDATAAVKAARAQLVAEGGSLVVEAAPAELRASVDPWGPLPSAFAIMQRLKQRFDPESRLNPGRFVGGL